MAALSQLQLPQHGVDAEDSDPFRDHRIWDPLLPSQLQYSADAAEMEVIQLPGLIGVHGLNLRSVQKCHQDDHLVHLQLGVQSKAVVIPRGGLQPTEYLAGVGDSMGDLVVDFRAARDLAVDTIELLLREKYDETGNRLGHAQILQLLKFCLKTYFTFYGTIYEQVKGTSVGSPISGLIVEVVLKRLESLVFQHHRPKCRARYVDDTFVVKEHLNAVFPGIQFTMEEEKNSQLTFLDVLVCRKDRGGLKTSVQEGDEHDASTELQQQSPNQSQAQLHNDAIPAGGHTLQ
ncbi:hypothetical protein SprV_0200683800 [Sparganum proliferum]